MQRIVAILIAVCFCFTGCAQFARESASSVICFGLRAAEVKYCVSDNGQTAKIVFNGRVVEKFKIVDGQIHRYNWEEKEWEMETPPAELNETEFLRFRDSENGIVVVSMEGIHYLL